MDRRRDAQISNDYDRIVDEENQKIFVIIIGISSETTSFGMGDERATSEMESDHFLFM